MAVTSQFCVFWTLHIFLCMCTKVHQNREIHGRITAFHYFQDGGGGHFGNWRKTSGFVILDSECNLWSVHRISSKSGDIYPFYSLKSMFKMMAAAIFEAIIHFRFCILQLWYDITIVLVKFCQDRTKADGVITVLVFSKWQLPPSWTRR
jgi:hypothetical protein